MLVIIVSIYPEHKIIIREGTNLIDVGVPKSHDI